MEQVIDRAVGPIVSRLPRWVTPNAICVIRGVAVIPVILVHQQHPLAAGFGIFLPAMLLDLFDGPLARHRGQTSELGAFLDATADKLLVHGVLWFALYPRVPLWTALVLSAADVALTVIRPVKTRMGKSTRANAFGKAKAWFQGVGIGFMIVRVPALEELGFPILLAAGALAGLSLAGHTLDLFRKEES